MLFNKRKGEWELHLLLEMICLLLGCLSPHRGFIGFQLLFALQSTLLKHAVCSTAEVEFVKCVCFWLEEDGVGEIKSNCLLLNCWGGFFLFLMGQQKNVEPEKTHTLKQTSSDKTVRCNESNQNSFLPTLVWLIPTSSSCHATREFDEIKTEHKDEAHRAQQSRLSWNLTCSV